MDLIPVQGIGHVTVTLSWLHAMLSSNAKKLFHSSLQWQIGERHFAKFLPFFCRSRSSASMDCSGQSKGVVSK